MKKMILRTAGIAEAFIEWLRVKKLRFWQNEPASPNTDECALLSEASLAEDWNKPEEDEAWRGLQ